MTYLRVTRGWRAKMKYKTPWSAEPKSVSAEGSTRGKAKRRLLEDKWKAIKDSWVRGSTRLTVLWALLRTDGRLPWAVGAFVDGLPVEKMGSLVKSFDKWHVHRIKLFGTGGPRPCF